MRIVLASHNAGKVRECQQILGEALSEVDIVDYHGPEPIEDGITFAENALLKARAASALTGLPALADDSGLCVDILGGSPGIFSARWSGRHGEASANNALLLAQLYDIDDPNRRAHFTAVLALVMPDAREFVVEGQWEGRLAHVPSGTNGHGYDPIFIPDGFGVTAAHLTSEQKNTQSHRSRAFDRIIPVIRSLLNEAE